MHDPTLRFFGVEHITAMFLGISFLHVGRTRSKLLSDGKTRHRRVLGFTLVALLLVIIGVPWPSRPYGRPLVRWATPHSTPVAACPPTYRTRCATCHGEAGQGDGLAAPSLKPPPRNFADPSWVARSDEDLAAIIRQGGAAHQLSVAMPAHPDLTDTDLRALISCLRSFRPTP
jgi:cytochrome c551/c552